MNGIEALQGNVNEALTATANDTLRHAVRAREAVLQLETLTRSPTVLQLESDAGIRQVARALNVPIRHRQLKHVIANLADILLDNVSTPRTESGASVARAFSPERDLRLWKAHDIVPCSAYHEAAVATAYASAHGQRDEGELRLQLLRCLLADAYCALLAEHIATAILTGADTENPALGAFAFPATVEIAHAVSAHLAG